MKPVFLKLDKSFRRLATDVGLDSRTVRYCLNRFKAEGVKFFTVTLPKLSKSVLRSLELGYFQRPTDIAWQGRSLRFFRSLLSGIFDTNGLVRETVDVVCLYALRQLCEYMYKLAFSFARHELARACDKYVQKEQSLATFQFERKWLELLRRNFETHYSRLSRLHVDAIFKSAAPRHGPGSFAGASKLRDPFYFVKLLDDSQYGTCTKSMRSFSGYFKPYPSSPTKIFLAPDERKVCEVLFVPKDSRGPRVISKEPMHLLRAQMAYFDTVAPLLESVTSGRVNFYDQSVNQRLTREASLSKDYATLDLRDASDSVSFKLVRHILLNSPGMRYFVTHFRSTKAKLPDGRFIQLRKLSGMGSGITFPTMALVIHLSICSLVSKRLRIPYREVSKEVYVYGDDLIVPSKWVSLAFEALNLSGLEVNRDKCFVNSHFRESCGKDYYFGNEVNPVRLTLSHANLPGPSKEVNLGYSGILQLERHCRELVSSGWGFLAEYYYRSLEASLGKLPRVFGSSPVLGRYSLSMVPCQDRGIKAWTADPERLSTLGIWIDPYKILSQKLRSISDDRLGHLFPEDTGNPIDMGIAIPRRICLRKRLIMDTALNGVVPSES